VGKVNSLKCEILQSLKTRDTGSEDRYDDIDKGREESKPDGDEDEEKEPDNAPDDLFR